jgi:multiple sugar transport system substrate-binding protein
MQTEQREALDNLVLWMRAGRLTRRSFLERATTLGLSAGTATSLLASCGTIQVECKPNSANHAPRMIVWASEYDSQNIFSRTTDIFNSTHPDSHVVYQNSPFKDRGQYQATRDMLQACDNGSDVISIDVIWLPEFARAGWVLPLDSTVEKTVRDKYQRYQNALDNSTYSQKLYSVPLRSDAGIFYYRSDVLSQPPHTWEEIEEQAHAARLQSPRGIINGYVWQGEQFEGLICNFIEVLSGHGGSLVDDPLDVKKITVYDEPAINALSRMMNWIGDVSPSDITTYEESDARIVWQNGFALYMRNWYNALSAVTDDSVSIVTKSTRFTTLPLVEAMNKQRKASPWAHGNSCIGGWQLGANHATNQPELVWQFINEIIRDPRNKDLETNDIYNPHSSDSERSYERISDIAHYAISRPRVSWYPQMSMTLQKYLSQALQGAYSGKDEQKRKIQNRTIAKSILKNLQLELEDLLKKNS